MREAMGSAAVALAKQAGYVNAGTVELIAERDDPSNFYFLEVNTRLQVEHPVTEEVTGLDLVELQLRVAAGEPLPLTQAEVTRRGWAIEARVYAEDPAAGFLPSSGEVVAYREAPGVRTDSGIEQRSVVGTDYDPMLAKVVARGDDREEALERLRRALGETVVAGPTTNVAYLRALLARPEVRAGEMDTGLIERLGDEVAAPDPPPELAALALVTMLGEPEDDDIWSDRSGWRMQGPAWIRRKLEIDSGPVEVAIRSSEGAWDWQVDETAGTLSYDRALLRVGIYADGDAVWVVDPDVGPVRFAPAVGDADSAASGDASLEAPMPGTVVQLRVEPGATVTAGETLVLMESMKMEISIQAPRDGSVEAVLVAEGDKVDRGATLIELVEEGASASTPALEG
jgi:acetyl-CoA/propionyl-CoA carboxylase biotin carboxyl carrier protein